MYRDGEDDLWLIPTAEVPITGMFAGQILEPGTVPAHFVAHTPCFRRERAAAGQETRGIKRVHQFDKVEMYKFVHPADSDAELERLVADAEDMVRRLGIPYRVIELAAGDLGFLRGAHLRPRDVGGRKRGVAGGQLVLELRRLPGPPLRRALPPGARR